MSTLRLVAADHDDLGYVEWLLHEADLPHEDVREGQTDRPDDRSGGNGDPVDESDGDDVHTTEKQFYLALVDSEPVGAGGLEFTDDGALVRSVVVEPDERGAGHGRALVEALLDRAADAPEPATAAYLLTTTAEDFFADLGFERVDRDRVPPDVRATRYFSDRCPSSATCMRLDLSNR